MKTFAELLASLRQEQGLTAYALAQRSGLSDQAIHNLEQKGHSPTLDTVRRLAKALGVTLDYLDSQLPPVELPEPQPGRPRGRPPKAEAGGDGKAGGKRAKAPKGKGTKRGAAR